MTAPSLCPRCGAPLPSPAEPCPRCLLQLGLDASAPPQSDLGQIQSHTRTPRFPPPTAENMAKHFRDLEVIELCGQGGMGVVYKARHTRLDRVVALKVLHQDASRDPAFAERFLREARALARLSHPGIVAVHDFGEVDGLFYLVMEFVDGVDLRRTIRGGELAPRQALTIVRELCEALQYAHDEGVVHRDIKPENVLIDKRGRVKIADFGLAKLAGSMLGGGALTATGQVMGTPHYMAPEQIERPQDVDHRADIYSLGVVLYEMLTGSLPLGRFEAPSRRVDIDVRLDEIVLRTLEREPARRYQHAVDVKTDVDGVGQGDAKPAAAAGSEPVDGLRYFVKDESGDRVLAAGVVGTIDPSSGAWPIVTFALVWVLVGWLFNFGAEATVFAGLVLVLVGYWLLRGRARQISELAAALDKERAGRKWLRAIAGLAFAWIGCASILAAHFASWERGTATYEPPDVALYLASNDQPNWGELQEIAQPGSGGESALVDSRFHFVDHERMLFTVPPYAYFAIAAAAWLAAALCFTAKRAPAWRVRPAIDIVASAFIALGLAHMVMALASDTVNLENAKQERHCNGPIEQCYELVHRWLLESGYQVDTELAGTVVNESGSSALVPQRLFTANETDVFDRWQLSWHGPQRTSPHFYFVCWSVDEGKQAYLEVDSGRRVAGSKLATEWDRRLVGLFRRLNE